MGNEVSAPYEGPPELLEGRDLPSVAKFIKSKECHKIFVMLGAGVSTAAGIPDFRSPDTGLYSNLARLNLPYPEAVFEISYFRENPVPFYTLARELYPGKFRPTFTHTFVKLLADHSYLDTCFTQNIDTLERQANIPGHRIVEAHGSFADQHCIECQKAYDGAKMKAAIEKAEIVRCAECGGLVKPDIVFFGESLPPLFRQSVPKLRDADLLLVIGTSLKVRPFSGLTMLVPESCPRILINMEPAGDIGTRADDVVLLGRCDDVIRDLCKELEWEEVLDREWAKTEILVPLDALAKKNAAEGSFEVVEAPEANDATTPRPSVAHTVVKAEVEDARLQTEMDALTEKIEKALEISESHEAEVVTISTVRSDIGETGEGTSHPVSSTEEAGTTEKEKL